MYKYKDVEFTEVEYQPKGVREAYPGIRSHDSNDIEMQTLHTRENRLRRLQQHRRLRSSSIETGSDRLSQRLIKPPLVRTKSMLNVVQERVDGQDYSLLGTKVEAKEIV